MEDTANKDSLLNFPKKKATILPGYPKLKTLLKDEWSSPDSKYDVGSGFKAVKP